MQSPPKDLRRRIVPRWRSIVRTPRLELENHREQKPVDGFVIDELRRRVIEWEEQKTSEAAQELLWAASVFGPHSVTEKSLHEMTDLTDLPDVFRNSARQLIAGKEAADVGRVFQLDTRKFLQQRIRDLKNGISIAPRNPIQYVELARLYSRLGEPEKARKSLLIASGLAPNSRFILRAATRFLVHVEDYARAVEILERGNLSDPWIQAARISVLDLSGKAVRDIKRARAVLEIDAHPRHLSELAGSLATLEYGSGNISRSKKLFKQGAIDPNDNVVAQLQWASQNKIVEFKPELLDRSLTFEARAAFARGEKKWKDAMLHCADWLQDEPFSLRPASMGSYLACELLQDYDKSIDFCETGLIANPEEFVLLNNIAFCHAGKGDIDLASRFLEAARLQIKSKEHEIIFLATSGMISFRKGQHEIGAESYMKAIDLARAERLPMYAQMAAVHYFAEFANLGSVFSTQEISQISIMMEDKKILEEVREIYSVRLKPLLVEQDKRPADLGFIEKIVPNLITS